MKANKVRKVFIVDDDKVYHEIIKHELRGIKNIQVQTFSSAEECLEYMSEKPDLVILDYYLNSDVPTNMTGHEALNVFQSSTYTPNVIFISSDLNEGLLDQYWQHRSIDFVLKNQIGSDLLVHKARYYLNQ